MTDGIKIRISPKELRTLLDKRIEEYGKDLGKGTIIVSADESKVKKAKERIAYLSFIKEHLTVEDYYLNLQDLVNLEIIFF